MEEHPQQEIPAATPAPPPTTGDRFISLGLALNNPDSTIRDLVRLALDCGLILVFSVTPNDPIDIEVPTK